MSHYTVKTVTKTHHNVAASKEDHLFLWCLGGRACGCVGMWVRAVNSGPVWYFWVRISTSGALGPARTHIRILHHGRAAASSCVTAARAKPLVPSAWSTAPTGVGSLTQLEWKHLLHSPSHRCAEFSCQFQRQLLLHLHVWRHFLLVGGTDEI